MSDPESTIVRTFDAPRATVWRAWTDPAIAAQWWHPHEVTVPPESVEIDLRVGGGYAYLMIDPTGGRWPTMGEYLEIREPERLRFTWGSPDDDRGDEHGVYDGWTEAFRELDGVLASG